MIVDKMIEVTLAGNIEYYESLGYEIPKYIDKKNRLKVARGTKILVNQRDIPNSSEIYIEVECDDCKRTILIQKRNYAYNVSENEDFICGNCLRKSRIEEELIGRPEESFGYFLERKFGKDNVFKIWSDENEKSPYLISAYSKKQQNLICLKNNLHKYDKSPNDAMRGDGCPYCSLRKVFFDDSFGYNYPKFIHLYSDKNKKSYYDVSSVYGGKIWWKCPIGKHDDFQRTVAGAKISNFTCPVCVKENKDSVLQIKVSEYLHSIFDIVLHEWDCTINPTNPKTRYKFRYDNEIPSIKLVVEVMGNQHSDYRFYKNFNSEEKAKEIFREMVERDVFKKQHALNIGYTYLDIWYYEDDKNETWKKKINQCLYDIGYFN